MRAAEIGSHRSKKESAVTVPGAGAAGVGPPAEPPLDGVVPATGGNCVGDNPPAAGDTGAVVGAEPGVPPDDGELGGTTGPI